MCPVVLANQEHRHTALFVESKVIGVELVPETEGLPPCTSGLHIVGREVFADQRVVHPEQVIGEEIFAVQLRQASFGLFL